MGFSEWVVAAFDSLTPNINAIYADHKDTSLTDWLALQKTMVTATGAAAVAIPGLHLFGVAADVVFLMNRMSVCSYGVGAIVGERAGKGNILEDEDFAVVLAKWSGVDGLDNAALAKTSADLVTKVGSKAASKALAKAMCKNAGILIGKKLSGKVGVKVGAKFGTKLGGKLVGGWIPFVGAVIGGGINLWFISEIANAAQDWYTYKASV